MNRAFAALALLLPGPALAAGPLDAVKADGVLHVGTPGDYRPYAIRAPDGSFSGAEIELVRDFAKSLGVRAEIEATTWKTMQDGFIGGKFDMVVGGISITAERARQGDFSIALSEDGKRPVVRCADKDRYTALAAIDRPEVRVVVNLGGTNEAFAHASFLAAPITVSPDNISVPQRLLDGQADVFVTDGAEVDLLARHFAGRLCAAAVAQPFTHLTKAWWLPQDAAFKQAVDAFLKAAKADGSWQAALDRNSN
jgi:cyclohexadienyl dehydratase